jgi:structure-specific recognition protein 1
VAIEFIQDQKAMERADVLTECRFFIPNPELEEEEYEEGKNKEAEDNNEEEKGKTPAQIVSNRIIKKAGIGEYAGHCIAAIPECPMLIPRGKYNVEFYETFLKLHGRTHDYKIFHKDINRAFLLSNPDTNHMFYVFALNT